MIDFKKALYKTCPKSGKITGINFSLKGFSLLLLPFVGLLATIWILLRVLPKPSRINYPCVKVALPFSTSFLVMLTGLSVTALSYTGLKRIFYNHRSGIAMVFLLLFTCIAGSLLFLTGNSTPGYAIYQTSTITANVPMGTAQGVFPGRVVWVHDPDATNENCTNTYNSDGVGNNDDDGWFLSKNTDVEVVSHMLSDALQALTETTTDAQAWDLLFKDHNRNRGKGKVTYEPGEKIFFKINATSNWGYGEIWGNIAGDYSPVENDWYGLSETSPQIVMALLRQLVNVVGVAQEDIYIGDPMRHVYSHSYDLWMSEFPNINILDHDQNSMGRTPMTPSTDDTLFMSDRGTVLTETMDFQYQIFHDCEYMFNLPMMKGHKNAGCTMFAKNHFGSHSRESANHYHPSLVNPDDTITSDDNFGYGKYRIQVDLMGYELYREKYVVFIMDALWSAGMELEQPCKFLMPPFNNDWTSSIFVSQDPVAIESVGYDFLHAEFTADKHPDLTHVQMEGTDDYLRQAADSTYWPEGFVYDPEKDGTPLPSLGVHEHWNNALDKQYSRNLGNGEGIELVHVGMPTGVEDDPVAVVNGFDLGAYPNPFNPSTTICFHLDQTANVTLDVYNMRGQKVRTLLSNQVLASGAHTQPFDASGLSSGVFFCKLKAGNRIATQKIMLIK